MGQSVLVNLPANSVTIADAGGYLSATTAEEAIQETGAVTAAGDITIELNGTAIVVAVELDDTAEQVASKIKVAVDAVGTRWERRL